MTGLELYVKRPQLLYGYALPFLLFYVIGLLAWATYFPTDQYEVAMVIIAAIAFCHILTILFSVWSVDVKCLLTCTRVYHPMNAKFAKVTPKPNNGSKELVPIHITIYPGTTKIWLEFQKVHYVYDADEKKTFSTVQFPVDERFSYYKNWKGYIEEEKLKTAENDFGNNQMEMVIPEFRELFQERATAPFFVFQVFCVGLWCLDEYWYYSLFTLFMLVLFEASLVYQQLRNMAEIRKMGNKPFDVSVYRNRKWSRVSSAELVAGDIVSISRTRGGGDDQLVPCDLLLLRGRLIVDEAMLTGESVPQMKEPIEDSADDTILNLDVHSRLHIVFGGTKVVQHTSPPKNSGKDDRNLLRPSDNGCVAYVMRTGFNTSQGKLLRTILFGVKRVTANNLETFFFILFLLIFAIAASAYVWIKGTEDPDRNRYKLLLNCVLILTSVVPPELPIELSLAVNSSLLALTKLYVFCTEPFRIPFAGKVDICCFDKTGTLTSDSLIVLGIAGVDHGDKNDLEKRHGKHDFKLCPVVQAPAMTQQVLASCHSLVTMNDELIGDPLEQAMLKAVDWNLTKGDMVLPKRKVSGAHPMKVVQRFHFSSTLKRMSVIACQDVQGSGSVYLATVKGAAEVLKSMFKNIPENYDLISRKLSLKGARVLALGSKVVGTGFSSQQIRDLKREDIEHGLDFAGFVVISSPMKHDSKAIISELKNSSHHITMITGDSPLTACHVANVLGITSAKKILMLSESTDDTDTWTWSSLDGDVTFPIEMKNMNELKVEHDLCLTGQGLSFLESYDAKYMKRVLPAVRVFARVSPKQKEQVVVCLKGLGYTVLMCGDGTNDVGALKHSNVGVALLSNVPVLKHSNKLNADEGGSGEVENHTSEPSQSKVPPIGKQMRKNQPNMMRNRARGKYEELEKKKKKLRDTLNEMEQDATVVKLGDASIASPFTYKLSSIAAVCHIIKQGRCTLVTTLQMFKILALNALVLAYGQSVLYLDGVKFGDGQATLQGLLLAGCFLFISRSKPLKVLSQNRPLPNIFNVYTIVTVLGQFAIHFASLIFLVQKSKEIDPRDGPIDIDGDFEPNLLNTTVYIISLGMQIVTFGVNYKGHPFMESLSENKALLISLLGSSVFLICLVTGVSPETNAQFQTVLLPPEFQWIVLSVLCLDLICTFIIDRILNFIFGSGRLAVV